MPLAVTFISQTASLSPPSALAVIITLSDFCAFTLPFDTEATVLSLDDHITFLLVALSGLIVAVSVNSSPSLSYTEVLSSVIDVTG